MQLVGVLLAASGCWILGQAGLPVAVTAPRAALVTASMAVAASCCLVVSNARRWRLVHRQKSLLAVGDRTISGYADSSQHWWRVARWPDGRYVADDGIAYTLAVLGAMLGLATAWMSGASGIVETGLDARWARLSAVLVLPACLTAIATSRRAVSLAARSELPVEAGRSEPCEGPQSRSN